MERAFALYLGQLAAIGAYAAKWHVNSPFRDRETLKGEKDESKASAAMEGCHNFRDAAPGRMWERFTNSNRNRPSANINPATTHPNSSGASCYRRPYRHSSNRRHSSNDHIANGHRPDHHS